MPNQATQPLAINERDRVAGVDKATQVIAAFGADRGVGRRSGNLSLADVAAQTGLSRAAARRYVLTLVHLGYVQAQGKLFSLTPRVMELGDQFARSMTRQGNYRQVCLQAAQAIGEAASVCVLHRYRTIGIAFTGAEQFAPAWTRPGNTMPAHCSAAGRVMLAGCTPQDLEEYFSHCTLERYTERTLDTPKALLDQIELVRQSAYSVEDQEIEAGSVSIAVALNPTTLQLPAALSIHVGGNRMSAAELVRRVLPALQKLQSLAGHDPGN